MLQECKQVTLPIPVGGLCTNLNMYSTGAVNFVNSFQWRLWEFSTSHSYSGRHTYLVHESISLYISIPICTCCGFIWKWIRICISKDIIIIIKLELETIAVTDKIVFVLLQLTLADVIKLLIISDWFEVTVINISGCTVICDSGCPSTLRFKLILCDTYTSLGLHQFCSRCCLNNIPVMGKNKISKDYIYTIYTVL